MNLLLNEPVLLPALLIDEMINLDERIKFIYLVCSMRLAFVTV